METALARLRAKTDRELGILVVKQLHRARKYAGNGAYRDAAKEYQTAKALLSVADIAPARRARLGMHDEGSPPDDRASFNGGGLKSL